MFHTFLIKPETISTGATASNDLLKQHTKISDPYKIWYLVNMKIPIMMDSIELN